MTQQAPIKSALLALALALTVPAWASTTYTYTDAADNTYSGSFSVASALADGSYSLLTPADPPAGFTGRFFTTPFLDGRGVERTPSLSLFDITIVHGEVASWDIRATSPFTSVTYSTCGRAMCKAYHDNSTLIFHATNVPYLPGKGMAYQAAIAAGDYKTYFTIRSAYQEAMTGALGATGVWSVTSAPPPVPEPARSALLLAGLGVIALMRGRHQRSA